MPSDAVGTERCPDCGKMLTRLREDSFQYCESRECPVVFVDEDGITERGYCWIRGCWEPCALRSRHCANHQPPPSPALCGPSNVDGTERIVSEQKTAMCWHCKKPHVRVVAGPNGRAYGRHKYDRWSKRPCLGAGTKVRPPSSHPA